MALEKGANRARVRTGVGVAKHELELTRAAAAQASYYFPPGRGRRLLVLSEVEVGTGRPDLVLVACSPHALQRRFREGLRLMTFTEARILSALLKQPRASSQEGATHGVSMGHFRQIRNQLADRGWLTPAGSGEAKRQPIRKSLLIEAKVGNWQGGLLQLARNSQITNTAALLLPVAANDKVPRSLLERYAIGLLLLDEDGHVIWRRRGRSRQQSSAANLWLSELAIRHLERGFPYAGFSSASNSASADK